MEKLDRYLVSDTECVSSYISLRGDWCKSGAVAQLEEDFELLEESHTELIKALELAEKKLVRLHLSLSLNEKAGRRSADKDPDVQKIRAAIAKAKATMNP